jgi:hypothetical protein
MNSRRFAPFLVLLVSSFVYLGLVQGAEARTFSTSTSFGFYDGSPDAFLGQVASNNPARCRSGRLVKVFRKRSRNDRLVGRDRAGATGQWIVEGNFASGRYYALVPRKRFGANNRHTCRAYRTSVLGFTS